MSIVPVHGPHTWGQEFFAESASIIVNLLGPMDLEFKSKMLGPEVADEADPYEWDFGDGTHVVNGFEVRHVYATPGTFTVKMTVDTTEGPVEDQIEITLDGNGFRAEVRELPEHAEAKPAA
jgi:hypothetical protein